MHTLTKTTRKHFIYLVLPIFAMLLLAGCASGPQYREVTASGVIAPPQGKGVVFVYWPNSLAEGQGNRTQVYANDIRIQQKLRPGSFCFYYADPGPLHIGSGAYSKPTTGDYVATGVLAGPIGVGILNAGQKKDMVVIEVKPGETYFVETHNGEFHEKMRLVSNADGEKKIQNCHWLGTTDTR